MWTPITDCGKQLTIHLRVMEKNDAVTKLYEIVEVEFDQFKLNLLEKNNSPVTEKAITTLSCSQLKKYAFEVEKKG
ncbi:MAG TPA: hypothetical protein VIJ75_11405 [Hanamia sp.]